MALQWLNDTPRAISDADAGLATGTNALWWQARLKGSFLLDLPVDNTRAVRFAAFTDDPDTMSNVRFDFRMRKSTPDGGSYQFYVTGQRNDDSGARTVAFTVVAATLDALLDPDEWYTVYMQAWPGDGPDGYSQIADSAGTVLASTTHTDGAVLYPMGTSTRAVVGAFGASSGLTIDGLAFGVDRLDVGDRHISPAIHGQALRYWLFEEGTGTTVAEETGNGQALTISGSINTDYEWIAGSWGYSEPPPKAIISPTGNEMIFRSTGNPFIIR
jgi:hypothetical protein